MVLNPSNSSTLEQLALKGLNATTIIVIIVVVTYLHLLMNGDV